MGTLSESSEASRRQHQATTIDHLNPRAPSEFFAQRIMLANCRIRDTHRAAYKSIYPLRSSMLAYGPLVVTDVIIEPINIGDRSSHANNIH